MRTWITDTTVSLPTVPNMTAQTSLGGFAFGPGGICHPIDQSTVEEYSILSPPMNTNG